MKTRRGDVVLVLFPNSDLRTAKRRPALVLQRDSPRRRPRAISVFPVSVLFAFESNIEHLTSDIAASAALILPSTLLLAPKAADRVFDSQLRKGAWLQRSFTLSTTCHAVASREGGSTIHLYESGDIHRQQISVAAAAEAFSEWSDWGDRHGR